MSIGRSGALLVGATASAAIIMVFLFQAPVLPVAVGAVVAALIIVRRSRGA